MSWKKKMIISAAAVATASTVGLPLAQAFVDAPEAPSNATSAAVARLVSWNPSSEVTSLTGSVTINNASLCTGSLVDSDWVLTAKHCIKDGKDKGFATFGTTWDSTVTRYNYKQIVPYTPPAGETNADLALIQLEKPVEGVTPMKLWDSPLVKQDLAGISYGWGNAKSATTDGTDHAKLPMTNATMGHKGILAVNSPHPDMPIYKLTYSDGKVINGDSGGPFISKEDNILYGVLSMRGVVDGDPDVPSTSGYIMPVASYAEWISDTTGVPLDNPGNETPDPTDITDDDGTIDFPEEAPVPGDNDDPTIPTRPSTSSMTTTPKSESPTDTETATTTPTRPSEEDITTTPTVPAPVQPAPVYPVVNPPINHNIAPVADAPEADDIVEDEEAVGPEVNTGGGVASKSFFAKIASLFA